MKSINLFIPTYHDAEILELIAECLSIGWTGAGFKTLEFEQAWKDYTGLPHAHFLNSATAGLELTLTLLKKQQGWHERTEVITTPITFISTNHAILKAGLTPVFADVDASLCLDPIAVERRITNKTKAVLFVGLGGNVGQLDTITRLCREYDLQLILDAAHMAGTRVNGQHVGHEAAVTVFSYHAVKNLPTADSGMICFADPSLDAEARKWAWLGIDKDTFKRTQKGGAYAWDYEVESVGMKAHGNSIMACMALVGLRYLDQDNARRRQIATLYDTHLPDSVSPVRHCYPHESSRHLYQVLVEDRPAFIQGLQDRGIYPGVHYRDNSSYRMYPHQNGLDYARYASDHVVSLPLHLRLTDDDVYRVCEAIMEVTGERNRQTT